VDVVIYDFDTKVSRSITENIYVKYGALCRGNYAVLSPDADGSGKMRWYAIDLIKAGFIKDGHVVPENDGGL
jgi:hypothetical protein